MPLPEKLPSILIVDDVPENLDVLKESLRPHFTVQPALNGELALRIARTDPPPDLILLDLMMPGMDGYEVLRRLQADPLTREIPVIFVTANDEVDSELKGFELGAVDYITKPYSVPLVNARVRTHLALRQAKRQLQTQNETLMFERELIESIIFRMRENADFDARNLRYLLSPVDSSNGDILFSTFTPDGRQWLLVGDITGHGLSAAVVSPLVSHVFYSQAKAGGELQDMLTLLNQVMHRQLPTGFFMAGCVAELSKDRKSLRLWNAGMPSCLLIRRGCVHFRAAPRILPPFGISSSVDYPDGLEIVSVESGDRLFMLSDGVTEVSNTERVQFGIERVEKFLCETPAAADLPAELLRQLEHHKGSKMFSDDITFLELLI